MEKQLHQEYRDELANKLKEIRNSEPENPESAKAKAQGYLDAKKETRDYQEVEKSHKENILENSPAEFRVDALFEELNKNEKKPFSKQELLEAMKAIDVLYENGQTMSMGYYPARLFEIESLKNKYNLGSEDEYDFKAMHEYLFPFIGAINRIGLSKDRDYIKFKPFNLSHADRVVMDRYESIDVLSATAYEYNYDKQEYISEEMGERLSKAMNFLNKFRKSPEQTEKEREDVRFKKQVEEDERQRQLKEKELNKFDPSI